MRGSSGGGGKNTCSFFVVDLVAQPLSKANNATAIQAVRIRSAVLIIILVINALAGQSAFNFSPSHRPYTLRQLGQLPLPGF